MILIYAYISHYKNYNNQSISFDSSYTVSFENQILSIVFNGCNIALDTLRNKYVSNLHLLVGKTGSGKTNLLQLIGESGDVRAKENYQMYDDEQKHDNYRLGSVDDSTEKRPSYFLLYRVNENEFLIEYYNIEIKQFPKPKKTEIPNGSILIDFLTVHFRTKHVFKIGETQSDFEIISNEKNDQKEVLKDALICNAFDINAFVSSPYYDSKDMSNSDFGNNFGLFRMISPYHRASLWQICKYILNYVRALEQGEEKKKVSLVLKSHNFAHTISIDVPKSLKNEYWTFYDKFLAHNHAKFDNNAKKEYDYFLNSKKKLSPKQMFIHDLWTDYALYLRKWIEVNGISDAFTEEDVMDEYQEVIDYYIEKEYGEDFTFLPDGERMSIPKRLKRLCGYIDRWDNNDPHGILWQIWDDIKDICEFLGKLDDKYFTIDTCTIPIVDMDSPNCKQLFDDMFERMEQYHPDNIGVFSKDLLPYSYTRLSTGEFQYAKIMGIVEDFLRLFDKDKETGKKIYRSKIILLDEPETFMHPELARNFINRLFLLTRDFMKEYSDSWDTTLNVSKPEIQIIIGTHSPFIISDVLPQEVIRLDINKETGNAIVLNTPEKEYFGANIHTILSDSFFLNSTIGEFSRKQLITYYKKYKEIIETGKTDDALFAEIEDLIPHIGDELIRRFFEAIRVK